ncbi:CCR4-NOT core exoribonuclease subunit [Saccharomycopsis crataegensis]|uniref:CCR4-Not complex 3'-5'-exoribonuclease subunit Ccr4 n=1 Tax=Saccharomycopsis crataegensis TaxID=43959 RepID=A0AAV5QGZ3_9ASCO|nr:CCR4-NOT core exoribonuclease subunit [Saccharomycopsis crataegensis]
MNTYQMSHHDILGTAGASAQNPGNPTSSPFNMLLQQHSSLQTPPGVPISSISTSSNHNSNNNANNANNNDTNSNNTNNILRNNANANSNNNNSNNNHPPGVQLINANTISPQLDESLVNSEHWQQQLTLVAISRRVNHPHAYAKAFAKNLKLGQKKNNSNSNPLKPELDGNSLVDVTTDLLQHQHDKDKHSQPALRNRIQNDEKLDLQLNDEKLLKDQETNRKTKFLEIEPSKQYWSSLDFSGQGICNISTKLFGRYEFLTKLYLNNNNLKVIPKEIKKLRFLRVLDVSNNKITELPKEMNQLFCLKYLYLFDNRIQDVPYEFGNLSELIFLGIEGNPFNLAHAKIVAEKGCKEFIKYIRDNNPARKTNILEDNHAIRKWVAINNDGESQEHDQITLSNDKSSFTILSYNTLCQHYATTKLYGYTPSWALNWDYRKRKILNEVIKSNCDIVCLQEVETAYFEDTWMALMKEHGYRGIFHNKGRARRGGTDSKKVDGCAVFYKHAKFSLVDKVFVEYSSVLLGSERFKKTEDVFNRFTNKDNIAIISYLEHVETKKRVIVVNTHLHWDPAFNDVKTLQVAVLLEELQTLCKKYSKSNNFKDALSVPILICGDFNSQIHSAVYQLLSNGTCVDHPDFRGVDYGKFTDEGFNHPFQFKSAYSNMGELPFTNFTPTFTEVIDYIWYNSQSVDVKGMLGKIPSDYLEDLIGFPDQNFPSDHVSLMCEMKFKNVEEGSGGGKNRSRKI